MTIPLFFRCCLVGCLAPLWAAAADGAPLKWGRPLLRQTPAWFASDEGRVAADNVLRYQSTEGGWPKNLDLLVPVTDEALAEIQRGGKANTIDNQATTIPISFVARAAHATGDAKYRAAVERGLDYLLASQYPNGGFPQFYPLREGYYSHITFNDGAMIHAVEVLRDVAEARPPFTFLDADRRTRAADAVARALDCILRTQLKQDGRLTAWCAQYDEHTLAPAWARKYEPPSLSGDESVDIVRFLMSIEHPSPEVAAAIEGAVAWFQAVAIHGWRLELVPQATGRPDRVLVADPAALPLWARFYELGTNRPLYMDRHSEPKYRFADIDYERRSGYDYHGDWPAPLLASEYPAWQERQHQPAKAADRPRPRLIVMTDFPPLDVIPGGTGKGPAEKLSDPDDIQSMVRLLLYANDLELEGLIASAGTHANIARKRNLLDLLDLYDQVDENLRRHDARYPTADALRAITWQGRDQTWGRPADEIIGADRDSEASEAIIRAVDRPDPRPVWVGVWGGPREVAQAVWKIQHTRSPAELQRFLGHLRIFMIGLGDKPGQDGSGQWLLDHFPDLFVIASQQTYAGMFAQQHPLGSLAWLNAHVREGHGPLGAAYPRSGYYGDQPGMQEGDTPTFLHLVSAQRGLNDPEQPDQPGWGGQYARRDPARRHWFDGPGPDSIRRWLPDFQADFARRAGWMLPPAAAAVPTQPAKS